MIKINILSPGRFHVCDLARELDKHGFDVKFYSFVPAKRAERFGLPRKCSASILPVIAPFLFIERKVFKNKGWAHRLRILIQDFVTGIYMRKCDICIAMTGDFVYAPRLAKQKGAIIIYERGSKYIMEQKKVLESIPSLNGKNPVPAFNVKREIESYELADYIAIASQHVRNSFLQYKFPQNKLFLNPYGVDLSMFQPASKGEREYDVIMVGGWSYRKGCDLIIEAIRQTNLKFLHVGGIVDISFPKDHPNFTHIDAVDQTKLINYYHQAKVFLLPSREEGLAMVQAQAIACNLPMVGSPDSGAEDLKQMVANSNCIIIIKEYTAESITKGIKEALRQYENLQGYYAGDAIRKLTWEAYGNRYAEFINKIVINRNSLS
ncbi:MAG: glycosyltransferase family 4 protein [Prevotella sp.]|nr:glycosyltransferase family 4 protein [Prevotella sp.]